MEERDIGYEVVSTAAESHLDRDASEVSSISISERSRDEHSSGAKPRVRIVKSMPISSTRHRRDTVGIRILISHIVISMICSVY